MINSNPSSSNHPHHRSNWNNQLTNTKRIINSNQTHNPTTPHQPTTNITQFSHRNQSHLIRSPRSIFISLISLILFISLLHLRKSSDLFLKPSISPHHLNQPSTSQIDPFPSPRPIPTIKLPRYLSYLPHSGFHNQRIALENALTLAHALNRTLLLPPCFLGSPVPFIRSDKLAHRLSTAASKTGLHHCRHPTSLQSRECLGPSTHTILGWDRLLDLSLIHPIVSLLDLPPGAFHPSAQASALGLHPTQDVFSIPDERVYQYRFSLGLKPPTPDRLGKFERWIDVHKELGSGSLADKPLITLGSLFGTARLRVGPGDGSQAIRRRFREAMLPDSAITGILNARAHYLVKKLGGPDTYWAAHVRLGDSIFRAESGARARKVLEELVTGPMGLTVTDLNQAIRTKRQSREPQASCSQPPHTAKALAQFNRRLYIATDAPVPHSEPALADFFLAFPCTLVLTDYGLGKDLSRLKNSEDGVSLGALFAPLLDAMVAGRSKGVSGTQGSTFSRFVVDVLFPSYHQLPIIERG